MRIGIKIIMFSALVYSSCNHTNKQAQPNLMTVAAAGDSISYQCSMKCESGTAYTAAGQ